MPDCIFWQSYPTRTWPATRYFVQYPTWYWKTLHAGHCSCVGIPEMSEWKCLNLAAIFQGFFRRANFRPQFFNLIVAAQIHLCPELYFEVSILFWHLVGWRRRLFAILPLENFSTFLSSFSFSSPDRRTKVAAAISTLFIQTWWQPPLLTCCF